MAFYPRYRRKYTDELHESDIRSDLRSRKRKVTVSVPPNYHVEVRPDIVKEKEYYDSKLVSASRGYDNRGNLVSSPESFRKKGARFSYYE